MSFPIDGAFFMRAYLAQSHEMLFDAHYHAFTTFGGLPERGISLRVYPPRLVFVAEAQVVAKHLRVFSRDKRTRGQTVFDWRHYLCVVQRKPGALRNGAPFLELPAP